MTPSAEIIHHPASCRVDQTELSSHFGAPEYYAESFREMPSICER